MGLPESLPWGPGHVEVAAGGHGHIVASGAAVDGREAAFVVAGSADACTEFDRLSIQLCGMELGLWHSRDGLGGLVKHANIAVGLVCHHAQQLSRRGQRSGTGKRLCRDLCSAMPAAICTLSPKACHKVFTCLLSP